MKIVNNLHQKAIIKWKGVMLNSMHLPQKNRSLQKEKVGNITKRRKLRATSSPHCMAWMRWKEWKIQRYGIIMSKGGETTWCCALLLLRLDSSIHFNSHVVRALWFWNGVFQGTGDGPKEPCSSIVCSPGIWWISLPLSSHLTLYSQ